MSQPRIMLLQVRDAGDSVIPEEIRIFARGAGVPTDHILAHNILQAAPTMDDARKADAVMIGGSGEYFVSKGNMPNFLATMDFLQEVVTAGFPMFASCFGFQLLVRALGGTVRYLPNKMELGTYDLALTGQGSRDELFRSLPLEFQAHLGHKDQATAFPAGLRNLAYSDLSPFQALRVPGKPIWATQFHPEVTRDENLGRFKRYIDEYARTMSPEELKTAIDRFQPAPDSEQLIPRFMQLVFG